MHTDTGHLFSALAFEEALTCSIYYVSSCLFVASDVSDLCLLVLSFCYFGDSGQSCDVLHCGQVVQEEREK